MNNILKSSRKYFKYVTSNISYIKNMQIQQIYQKKTQLEHILLRPDTYVGSVQFTKNYFWILSESQKYFIQKQIEIVPALFKIFDQVLVNAADNYRKDNSMNILEVEINADEGFILVKNNGKGIPIVLHKEYDIYVPQLIFGHLLTGSNYNDNQKKVTGGRNGYGAKLANIFSKKFILEATDGKGKKKFRMEWKNNMSQHSSAEISHYTGKDTTTVKFYPDLSKFNMKTLDQNITSLLKKRVYDMAGILSPHVKVYLNKEQIKLNGFSDYVNMYFQGENYHKIIDKQSNNQRWQVIVSTSDTEFKQVSFVNSICTFRGGTHVDMIANQIIQKIQQQIKKKYKQLLVKPHQIRSHLWIFINCLIQNPAFDSQTKETLTTKVNQFGSTFELSQKAIKQILKTGIIDNIVNQAKAKQLNKLAKVTGGGKKQKITGIPKLEDANQAGTKNSDKCTLILTQGDSAKGLAMAGIQIIGRDYFGVFPLKGKLLNVREASNKQILQNAEIQNIIKILGLQIGKQYQDTKQLRYGALMIMSDQDADGSHIKGLIINFIHTFWPSLIKLNTFLKCFITPILKTSKGKDIFSFYSIQDYKTWCQNIPNLLDWKIKYYKGLGTSTDKQAKQYFSNIQKSRISFEYANNQDDQAIDMCFSKKKVENRKKWLQNYSSGNIVDYKIMNLRYLDFVNKQLIHFSIADNMRSIPSLCDGLKPGQRKVLYACFKRNLKDQIKVAQLSGYVAQHSAYHHGQMSLAETIIGMAQNFVGSNNINLLQPIGQFGSRNQGGKEHASARYIFTSLSKVTRYIFKQADDHILEYEEDDGQFVEPKWYLPIIPMVLVNGAEGIGTGWSTYVPQFSPRIISQFILNKLNGIQNPELIPFYKGFQGEIIKSENSNFISKGKIQFKQNNLINILQLPIAKWTRDYKNFLEQFDTGKQKGQNIIQGFKQYHTNNRVNFEIKFNEGILQKWGQSIYKNLKLVSNISMHNLVLFNHEGRLHKYQQVEQIINQFYVVRLKGYQLRKQYELSKLKRDLQILQNKMRFIKEVIEQQINIKNVKKIKLFQVLSNRGYLKMSQACQIKSTKNISEKNNKQQDDEAVQEVEDIKKMTKEYDYLLSMPFWNLAYEKVQELQKQLNKKRQQYDLLYGTTIQDIWRRDLKQFLNVLNDLQEKQQQQRLNGINDVKPDEGKKKKQKKKKQKMIEQIQSNTKVQNLAITERKISKKITNIIDETTPIEQDLKKLKKKITKSTKQ